MNGDADRDLCVVPGLQGEDAGGDAARRTGDALALPVVRERTGARTFYAREQLDGRAWLRWHPGLWLADIVGQLILCCDRDPGRRPELTSRRHCLRFVADHEDVAPAGSGWRLVEGHRIDHDAAPNQPVRYRWQLEDIDRGSSLGPAYQRDADAEEEG